MSSVSMSFLRSPIFSSVAAIITLPRRGTAATVIADCRLRDDARRGPCYRCLFPEPPPPGAAPSCQEAGVLGVLPGLVGCVQALETIKLLLGSGKPLIGRMVYFDTLSMELRIHKLRKDPNCPMCGEHPTITKLIDYEEFCGLRASGANAAQPAHA